MPANKFRHRWHRCDKVLCEFREWRFADYHQQSIPVTYHSGQFIRLIPDASIVADCYPSFLPNRLQPDIVRAVGRKKIAVASDAQPRVSKDVRKPRT